MDFIDPKMTILQAVLLMGMPALAWLFYRHLCHVDLDGYNPVSAYSERDNRNTSDTVPDDSVQAVIPDNVYRGGAASYHFVYDNFKEHLYGESTRIS